MKHPPKTTVYLVLLFLVAQLIGLAVVHHYTDVETTAETGVITYKDLPSFFGYQPERPEATETGAIIYFMGAIIVGTALILLLARLKSVLLWKIWYFVAMVTCLHFAFAAFLPSVLASILATVFGWIKTWRPKPLIHNITELFVYSGLVVIFIDLLTVRSAAVLLLLISTYDMYAVWRSGHMITIATFQKTSNVFAGFSLPATRPKRHTRKRGRPRKTTTTRTTSTEAILGGGDIGFPLLFTGTVMQTYGLAGALIVTLCATLALALLLTYSKQGKYYPAMPYVTLGTFAGFVLTHLAF